MPWEVFRKPLAKVLKRSDGARGGRPAYDPVMMFKIMVLQALYGLSDDQAEFQIQDRLSFMRFLGLGLGDRVPDAKTIWLFREHLTQACAVENLFARFDKHLAKAGYLAMGGQIVDATIVAAPKQRNTDAEKADIKAGKVPDAWKEKPAKLRQKDRDARWTVKFSKAKVAEEGKAQQRDIAIPAFGYKMGWLPPSPDGIARCAKIVVGKSHRAERTADEGHDDRGGSGKECFPTSRGIDDGSGAVSQEVVQGPVSSLHGEPASRCCCDGGLRQRPSLGAGIGETGP